MANVAADHQGVTEEDILSLVQRNPVQVPILLGIRVVPVKASALLQWIVSISHILSIW